MKWKHEFLEAFAEASGLWDEPDWKLRGIAETLIRLGIVAPVEMTHPESPDN